MLEMLKKGFEKVTGAEKKEVAEIAKQKKNDEVGAAIRNCLGMEKEGNNSLFAYKKEREDLSMIPHPYSEENNRLWELKKSGFNSKMEQIASIMKREINFVKDSRDSGIVISSSAVDKMEKLREEFISMRFSDMDKEQSVNSKI